MRQSKDLRGLAVVAIDDGRKLGTLHEVIVSPNLEVAGILVRSGGPIKSTDRVVEANDIKSIGKDAVTVDLADFARNPDDAGEQVQTARAGDRGIDGKKVVTESGDLVGEIGDYTIDEATMRVTSLSVGSGLFSKGDDVRADRVVSVGPDVVVIRD